MNTVGQLVASIIKWMREDIDESLVIEAVSDSVVSLWETLVLINLSEYLGGSVTAEFAPASDHADVVSIPDPVTEPGVVQEAGGELPDRVLTSLQFTWVTDSGSETLPSPNAALIARTLLANFKARVTTGVAFGSLPNNAVGWNLYAYGIKQNDVPIGINEMWYEPDTGFRIEGGDGLPTANTTGDDVWYIRTMSVDSEQGLRNWEATEIGSNLWNTFSRFRQSNGVHVYDFDGSRILAQPAVASGLSVNYFYVKRPRALLFKNSTVPFRHPGAVQFIKYNAQSLLHLSNHEYQASREWGMKAEGARMQIAVSANKKNVAKNVSVKPIFR